MRDPSRASVTFDIANATIPGHYYNPCANTDQCHYWPRYDDRCHRNTQAHTDVCSVHADRDTEAWWTAHLPDKCCPDCCRGEIDHV